jgi:hypothetical protein
LERAIGDRLFLCTQNVDDLHEKAGSSRVHHMHGELFRSRCEACGRPPFEDHLYPAAGFVGSVSHHARTVYVGPEHPDNADTFDECRLGWAGDVLATLFEV